MRGLYTALFVVIAPWCNAAMILQTTIQATTDNGTIGFGLAAHNGVSSIYTVLNASSDITYWTPSPAVDLMYSMVHNPSNYMTHGPLWAWQRDGSFFWYSNWDSLLTTHYDDGLLPDSCCAQVNTYGDVANVPWKAVSLERTGGLVIATVYDSVPVPEPCVVLVLWAVLGLYFIIKN
jgi:hypothetical protein